MTGALLLERVRKAYDGHMAVRDLSLSVPSGSIYGLLGPNGAGKSTTLRMVMTILGRDGGDIRLLGKDPERDRKVLQNVGYLPEERGLYKKMKAIDVIVFFAGLKGVPASVARSKGTEWLERMELGKWRDAKVQTLSKGMQQKVQFITTVIHEPEVLILDEPQSGLDPVNQEVLRETILEAAAAGRTVVLSTHNMEQAQQLCEHVCIIAEGQKVLDGRLDDVRRSHRGNRFLLDFDTDSPAVEAFLGGSRLIAAHSRVRRGWEVELAPTAEGSDLLREVGGVGAPVRHFEHVEPTLHEIFVEQVSTRARARTREEVAHA